MSVVFYGDPHGVWAPLLAAVRNEVPDAVVLLGDCDLTRAAAGTSLRKSSTLG